MGLARATALLFFMIPWLSPGCMLKFPSVVDDAGLLCGNGIIDESEFCDDGNRQDGDGCSATCDMERGWTCGGQPSRCHTLCGDNIQAGEESCDGSDLAGESCQSLGHAGGDLRCASDCSFDESACAVCGSGRCDSDKGETIDNCPSDCAFVQLAVGYKSSCALRADGALWCWGANDAGQLGSGQVTEYESAPVPVVGISSAVQVDVGGHHACALVESGEGTKEVWCWGENLSGQLGNADLTAQPVPTKVSGIEGDVEQIDVGWAVSCARLSSRPVACWGIGRYGLLGCEVDESAHPEPVILPMSEDIDDLSCDAGSCCVRVAETRQVKCWGSNHNGDLGNDTVDSTCIPVPVGSIPAAAYLDKGDHYGCIVDYDGGLWCWGTNGHGQILGANVTSILTPTVVPTPAPLQHVWLGWYHTCGATKAGRALCWGTNDSGQLGNGQNNNSPQSPVFVQDIQGAVDVEAGVDYSCALLDSGHIRCWGSNDRGQLGNGNFESSSVPVDLRF